MSPSLCSSGSGSGGSSVPVHYSSNYCHPIYEVPRYPGLMSSTMSSTTASNMASNMASNTLGHPTLASSGHLNLANGHGHTLHNGQLVSGHLGQHHPVQHHLGHQGRHNIYEQGTLDSQLTAKIY